MKRITYDCGLFGFNGLVGVISLNKSVAHKDDCSDNRTMIEVAL